MHLIMSTLHDTGQRDHSVVLRLLSSSCLPRNLQMDFVAWAWRTVDARPAPCLRPFANRVPRRWSFRTWWVHFLQCQPGRTGFRNTLVIRQAPSSPPAVLSLGRLMSGAPPRRPSLNLFQPERHDWLTGGDTPTHPHTRFALVVLLIFGGAVTWEGAAQYHIGGSHLSRENTRQTNQEGSKGQQETPSQGQAGQCRVFRTAISLLLFVCSGPGSAFLCARLGIRGVKNHKFEGFVAQKCHVAKRRGERKLLGPHFAGKLRDFYLGNSDGDRRSPAC